MITLARGGIGPLLAVLGLVLVMSKKTTRSTASSGGPTPFINYTGRNLPHIQYEYQLSEEDPLAPSEEREESTFVSKSTGVISPGTFSTGVVRRNGVLTKIVRQSVDQRFIK